MKQQYVLASSQIISFNPILKEDQICQLHYFLYLRKLVSLIKYNKRKYPKAQLKFYQKILCGDRSLPHHAKPSILPSRYQYMIPFDLALILGLPDQGDFSDKISMITKQLCHDFKLFGNSRQFLYNEFAAALGSPKAWDAVKHSPELREYKEYLDLVRENIIFVTKRPYNVLITANMSAGKSTLINALTGKNISLTQNMACTSKIHTIVSKPFDDGVTSEYDHDLSLDASSEDLLSDNTRNLSSKITVGTFFNGELSGKRVVLLDSPGVNSSENTDHMEITQNIIRSRKYQLMLYVMNATQLGTNDEELHLEMIKEQIGRTPIIFIINKVDQLITDQDNIPDIIQRQKQFLISKGFKNPLICPVSSQAAYLAKKQLSGPLSFLEEDELFMNLCKFKKQSLSDYYTKNLNCKPIPESENKIQNLLGSCGFAYLEQIINHLYDGGKVNGSGLC